MDRIQLTIPRSKWTGAGRSGHGESGCTPDNSGAQCCLGHHLNIELGPKWWKKEADLGMPYIGMPHALKAYHGLWAEHEGVARVLALINDAAPVTGASDRSPYLSTQANRELLITHVMDTVGIDVTFVD